MNELTAFERQVSLELRAMVGPVPQVDAAAVARSMVPGSSRSRPGQVSGVLRFAAAAGIVAVFAGVLLTSVLIREPNEEPVPGVTATTSPSALSSPSPVPSASPATSPGPSDDLLSRIVTEEVEPGVLRVVNDGVRDLAWVPVVDKYCCYYDHAVAVAPDGTPWFFRPEGFFALSGPTHAWGTDNDRIEFASRAPYVFRDRTLWTIREGRLLRADPHELPAWTRVRSADAFLVDASGSLSVMNGTRDRRTERIASSDDDGATWTDRDLPSGRSTNMPGGTTWVGADETAWMVGRRGRVVRSDGSRWREADVLPGGKSDAEVGPDGTVWLYYRDDEPLAWVRYIDGEWTAYAAPDVVPRRSSPHDGDGQFQVAPDGSVWFTAHPEDTDIVDGSGSQSSSGCDGIARFDGARVDHFLRGLCPWAFAIADDGTVWVVAGADPWYEKSPTVETYVIRPEVAIADR